MNTKQTDSTTVSTTIWRCGVLFCGLLLSACGNKGDLYIPKAEPTTQTTAKTSDQGDGDGLD